jgi:hypothetical protein
VEEDRIVAISNKPKASVFDEAGNCAAKQILRRAIDRNNVNGGCSFSTSASRPNIEANPGVSFQGYTTLKLRKKFLAKIMPLEKSWHKTTPYSRAQFGGNDW